MNSKQNLCFPRKKIYLAIIMLFIAISAYSQVITVKGNVKDTSGNPVIGASIVLSGSNTGTITDANGNYTLSKVPSDGSLSFSYIGMAKQVIRVAGKATINVTMQDDSKQLSEVVVTALGIKKEEKALGYAISTVSSSEIVKTGTPNFATALYGKAPGIRIQAAPGGSTSAVSINIRGLSSITGTNQPLVILNGVPIRNGDANKEGYWTDQRINSNGLVDINPEDIENISILKGASASALYGSEAANGVIMITTKSGRATNAVGVDFSATVSGDWVAYMPKYQKTFGPGVPIMARSGEYEISNGGFYERTYNNNTYRSIRSTSMYFGPKYDGKNVLYYDGKERAYSPISDNPWNDIFRTGFNQTYNLAITKGNEKGNMRFSYTFVDNLPSQYNSTYKKHNFNLTGEYALNNSLKLGYSVNYILQDIKNRPYRISRLTNNYGGMMGAFDDIDYIRNHTITSKGYLNVVNTSKSVTPDESFAFPFGCRTGLIDEYFWNIYGKEQQENNNRLIASVTPSWEIIKGLVLRGRASTDYTTEKIENKNKTEAPIAYGKYTGEYKLFNSRYEIYYGDIMLMYNKKLTDKLGLTANAGLQGRTEKYYVSEVGTNGGLTVENWFHINASKKTAKADMVIKKYLKTAALGTVSLSWDDYLYLEGTARQEKTSTLAKGHNSFFYPSVNTSFIYTQAFRNNLPQWYDYGKIRLSYGIVGNAPEIYKAVKAYKQEAASGYIYNMVDMGKPLGNENIKPEKKHEFEIGLENKFFGNRLGFEVTYYQSLIKDQILETTMPESSGASSILMNVGELESSGLELSVYGTLFRNRDWQWDLSGNIAFNKNKVKKLTEGIDVLVHTTIDGGATRVESHVGSSMGDIYAYAPQKDDKGNCIVGADGFYKLTNDRVKVGNAMPKATGGINTSVSYKNFSLSTTIDFRIGGAVLNTPYQYMMGRGAIKESMANRDAEHGGISFYYPDNNFKNDPVAYTGSTPKGETVYDNGMILKGVTEDGKPNTKVIATDHWLWYTYAWGVGNPNYYSHSIFKNSYVKVRELSLAYSFPKAITNKFACQNLTLSVFGRNLFYIHKNLPIFDAEATDGTSWITQTEIGGSTATTRTFGLSVRASF